jgi:signal transduction histidine kinase
MTAAPLILYVDQDPEARLVLPRFLARMGRLSAVDSLAAARAAIAQEPPAVLVIDPAQPDGDGAAFVAEVRARRPWVQIFALLAAGWADRTLDLIAAGANDVAVKPFDVGRLGGRVVALLRAAEAAQREIEYRQKLEDRVQHVDRIATLGTLCATVAHELGSPLTAIHSSVAALDEALSAEGSLDARREEMREAVAGIRVAADLMKTLVHRIRGFSRRDERRRVNAPLGQVVDTALLLVKPRLAGRGVQVHRPDGPAPAAPHYPIRLTQALLNLLVNAVEAIGDEGRVTLRWLHERDEVGIAVDDDGHGLSEEVQQRLREPFFTSKAGGTGLGLLIVRSIMEEHGGRFELLAGPQGGGASGRLLLPRAVDEGPSVV